LESRAVSSMRVLFKFTQGKQNISHQKPEAWNGWAEIIDTMAGSHCIIILIVLHYFHHLLRPPFIAQSL
jgi:hypothetical protein